MHNYSHAHARACVKVAKLGPECNNVRWEKCAALLPPGCARVAAAEETATPHVNNAILADMFPRHHLQASGAAGLDPPSKKNLN